MTDHGSPVVPEVALELTRRLSTYAWVTDVWAAGSVATGDYRAGVADLGLTSMARGRHTTTTGRLLTKTAAIEQVDAPGWLVEQLRARRSGAMVTSPRLRTALVAWRDACRTIRAARRG